MAKKLSEKQLDALRVAAERKEVRVIDDFPAGTLRSLAQRGLMQAEHRPERGGYWWYYSITPAGREALAAAQTADQITGAGNMVDHPEYTVMTEYEHYKALAENWPQGWMNDANIYRFDKSLREWFIESARRYEQMVAEWNAPTETAPDDETEGAAWIENHIRDGHMINAVKVYRETYGVDFDEAYRECYKLRDEIMQPATGITPADYAAVEAMGETESNVFAAAEPTPAQTWNAELERENEALKARVGDLEAKLDAKIEILNHVYAQRDNALDDAAGLHELVEGYRRWIVEKLEPMRQLAMEISLRYEPCGYYCDPDEYGGGHHDHKLFNWAKYLYSDGITPTTPEDVYTFLNK